MASLTPTLLFPVLGGRSGNLQAVLRDPKDKRCEVVALAWLYASSPQNLGLPKACLCLKFYQIALALRLPAY